MGKGRKKDKEAREIFKDAGYTVEKSTPMTYGRTDWWGLFDFMAVSPRGVHFVQVKSAKNVSGISEMAAWYEEHAPESLTCEYLIYHDNEGWRRIVIDPDSDGKTAYRTAYDERKDDRVQPHVGTDYNLGDGMIEHLSRSE